VLRSRLPLIKSNACAGELITRHELTGVAVFQRVGHLVPYRAPGCLARRTQCDVVAGQGYARMDGALRGVAWDACA